MTIFTAVSIALSTSGSSFAGLNHLSNVLEFRVKNRNEEAKSAYTLIAETVPDVTAVSRVKAQRRLWSVTFWFRVWKYCAFLPIVALVIFSFWVGARVALELGSTTAQDLAVGEQGFYATWIWVIMGVSLLALVAKLFSWWRVESNTTKLVDCRLGIEESRQGNGEATTNLRPAPA
jgi:hypothetical protein